MALLLTFTYFEALLESLGIEPSGDAIINGGAELDLLSEELGIDFPNGEYETLAGLLTFHTGKIPVKGDKVLIGNNVYEIIRVTPRAVKKVILKGR